MRKKEHEGGAREGRERKERGKVERGREERREEGRKAGRQARIWWFCPQAHSKVPLSHQTQPGEKPAVLW